MIPAAPIYNPLVLGREETLETYVARIPLLERMVEDLRAERPANKLILGQRGMGKTTLLHRLRFAIDDDAELKARWLALAFPEEQYDAARLSDFYLNCLDALGDSLERRGDGDGACRLEARVQQLAGMPENDLAGKALGVLLEEAARAGKGLVLLVDNADRILEGIGSQEQWGLRNLLEQDRRLMLIGAATQPMSCCYDYGKAFYDFFFIQDLAPLSEDEAREMLLRLGGRHQLEDRIRAWIDEDRARLRTLVTLTGGNPRTVAILFGLLAQGTDGDVRSELERLLDLATPLFKARLEELPRQAQQIVDALAQHWHPITAAALSELVRLEQGIVSSQLSRLARQGILEKVPYFPDTKLAFQIAERFFNIWYLMRSSRRARTKLRWLVHFLRLFYSQPELERDAGQHLRRLRSAGSSERAAEWAFALGEAVDKRPLRATLESVAIRSLLERGGGRADFSEPFEAGGQDASILSLADRTCVLEETRKAVLKARLPDPARNAGEFWDLLGGSLVLTVAEKRRLGFGVERLSQARFTELVKNLEQDREELRAVCPELADALMEAIRSGVAANWDDVEGLLAAKEALDAPQLDQLVNSHPSLVEFLERHRRVDRWVDRASAGSSCTNLGLLLYWELDRNPEAETAFRKATRLAADDALAWKGLGDVLRNLKRPEEAEKAFRRAVEIDAKLPYLWNNLGRCLEERGDLEGAQSHYERAMQLDSGFAYPWVGMGNLQAQNGRYALAESSFRKAIELDSNYMSAWAALGWLLMFLGRLPEAESAFRRALEIEPAHFACALHLSSCLAKQNKTVEAVENLKRLIKDARPALVDQVWDLIVDFSREMVRHGKAKECLRLLDESELSERWVPLREAMAAVVAGSADYLRRVAPEARGPAEQILEKIDPSLPRKASRWVRSMLGGDE